MQAADSNGLLEPGPGSIRPEEPAIAPTTYEQSELPLVLQPWQYGGTDAVSTTVRVVVPHGSLAGTQEVEFQMPKSGNFSLNETFVSFTVEIDDFSYVEQPYDPTKNPIPAGIALSSPPAFCGFVGLIGTTTLLIGDRTISKGKQFVYPYNLFINREDQFAKEINGEMNLGCCQANTRYCPALMKTGIGSAGPLKTIVSEASTPFRCLLTDEVSYSDAGLFRGTRNTTVRACGNHKTFDYANYFSTPVTRDIRNTRRTEVTVLFRQLFPDVSEAMLSAYGANNGPEMKIRIHFDITKNMQSSSGMHATPSMYAKYDAPNYQTLPGENDIDMTEYDEKFSPLYNHARAGTTPIGETLPKRITGTYHSPIDIRTRGTPNQMLKVTNPRLHVTFLHLPQLMQDALDESMRDGSLVFSLPVNTQTYIDVPIADSSFVQANLRADGEKIETILMFRKLNSSNIDATYAEDDAFVLTRLGPFEIMRPGDQIKIMLNQLPYFQNGPMQYPIEHFLNAKRALGSLTVHSAMYDSTQTEPSSSLIKKTGATNYDQVQTPSVCPFFQPTFIDFPMPFNIANASIVIDILPPTPAFKDVTGALGKKYSLFESSLVDLIIHTRTPFLLSSSRVAVA